MMKILIFAAAIVAFGSQSVTAATVALSMRRTAAFDTAFRPVPLVGNNYLGFRKPMIYEITVSMTVSDLGPGELGVGSTSFDVSFIPNSDISDGVDGAGGWGGFNPNVDINGAPPPGAITPRWSINADAGGHIADLKTIVVSIASGVQDPVDPRRSLGQSGSLDIGAFYARWNGIFLARVELTNHSSVMNLTDGQFASVSTPGSGATLRFGQRYIPEPTAICMAGTSFFALVAMRRRRKT